VTRRTMLMAVYNPIEVDGRVKRACGALSENYDLTLLCPMGEGTHQASAYRIERVRLAASTLPAFKLLGFWRSLITMARRMRPDVVYAHDFFLPFPGWVAAKLSGARLVYDAHELITPTDGENLGRKEALFYRLEQMVVNRADLVIAANPERAEVMRDHYRMKQTPVSVGNVPPRSANALSDAEVIERYPGMKRRAAGDVHVVYMGDVSFARGLDVLVEASTLLPANFKIVFVGGGPDLARLRETAARDPQQRIIAIGPIAHAHVHDVIRQADIGYISYSMKGLNNLLCAPNKVFEYANAGLPMLATCQPTLRRMFSECTIGRVVGCDGTVTAQGVAAGLQAVAADLQTHRAALDGFLARYSWNVEAQRLVTSVDAVFRP
jgi:hypothetical protein